MVGRITTLLFHGVHKYRALLSILHRYVPYAPFSVRVC